MSFLFKSKKNQDRGLSSREGPPPNGAGTLAGARPLARDEKSSLSRATPTGSLNSFDNDGGAGSPDQGFARRGAVDAPAPPAASNDVQLRNGQVPPNNPNAVLYPWSQRRLTYTSGHPSPFPRYGAAVNGIASKEGDIYVMGGLINSQTVKGDLWMIEAGGSMTCYPLATTAEGPGPRVGHSSLLVGNAFIVYGGDTKIEESDALDETLYLLNTSTRQWSRALPAGLRPSGRYGHSLNILGSKIYIFGGQVEGYFMNDLSAFDLNQLQMPNNRWEMLIPNTDGAAQPQGKVPPARTNHSVITYNDKMYLFGGTNGFQWFNDVWCYDAASNSWSQLDCIGYIPLAREGHAASIVDDVMYIFGGRTEEGVDLGDLAAFRITSRRWYTFQNMGPSPSPRSGHSMTTVGKSVVVVGGEPSSAPATVGDLGLVYVLDTAKIRYPNDAQVQQGAAQRSQSTGRRPSQSEPGTANAPPVTMNGTRNLPSRDGSRDGSQGPPDPKRVIGAREGAANSPTGFRPPNGMDVNGGGPVTGPPSQAPGPTAVITNGGYKGPRAAVPAPPQGPPPQGQPPKPSVTTTSLGRPRNASNERNEYNASPVTATQNVSPITREVIREVPKDLESPIVNGRRTPTQPVAIVVPKNDPPPTQIPKPKTTRMARGQGSVDSSTEPSLKTVVTRPTSPPPPTRQTSNPLSRRSSGRNSQTVALLKELDSARNRNAWYASELELARKAGYAPNATLSPVLDSRGTETFDDEDKPLIEALLAMRSELANVQSSVDKQAILAARQIAEADQQRDAAIQEAVYAKAKLAAHMGGSSLMAVDRDAGERSGELSRKLALALNGQKELQATIDRMSAELDAEKRTRKLADDTSNATQKRMMELENFKQKNASEVERLKAELHVAQRAAREQSVMAAEAVATAQILRVEKDDFQGKYKEAVGTSKASGDTFGSLREAIAASEDTKNLLEKRLEEERSLREKAEARLNKLKAEHETRTAELVASTKRLRDAEVLAEKHATEARTHRQAVLTGLDRIPAKDTANKPSRADADRIIALQGQLNAANALVKKYQQEADSASDKLRSAEERIAGLEAYQEQSSREGVTIRRQLQNAMRDTQTLQAQTADLKHQLANQQLETNAMAVQHTTLKDILVERGISPTTGARTRGSPRDSSPEQSRMRELEKQLAEAHAAHEDTKQNYAVQANESDTQYRDKLTQLENDYQSAVHYVKGTEKMLKQLKEQLAKYKADNGKLKEQMEELEGAGGGAAGDWERERVGLTKKVDLLQAELATSKGELERQILFVQRDLGDAKRERDVAVKSTEEAASRLTTSRRDFEQLQHENALLERRAQDAEQKVSLLLDQVETSVGNYRRRSRQVASMGSDTLRDASPVVGGPANGSGAGGARDLVGGGPQQPQAGFGLGGPGLGGGGGMGGGMGMGIGMGGGGGMGHVRQDSSEAGSVYGSIGEARNSAALDSLANELETLRSHWETTSKNYRLSNAFDFDGAGGVPQGQGQQQQSSAAAMGGGGGGRGQGDEGLGLSESLADWRKRLDG